MNPVDAYLAELDRRLRRKLSNEVVDARLRELRAHLGMALEETDAATALRRFGSPAATARAIVRQARGYDTRSAASLTWISGLVLAATLVLPAVAFDRFVVGEAGFGIALLAAIFASGFLIFSARCFQTRRWLVLPALAWATMAVLGLSVVTQVRMDRWYPAPTPAQTAVRIASLERRLAGQSPDERAVALWREGKPSTGSVPVAHVGPRTTIVPGIPWVFRSANATYESRPFSGSAAEARRAWDANGEGWARLLAERRRLDEDSLDALKAGRQFPGESPAWLVKGWILSTARLALFLFVYNAFALLLGRLVDALPGRRSAV